MSATKLAEAGMAAIESSNWDEAIVQLSKAINQSKSPQWLLERSRAYMETGQTDKSLRDAEYAYCTAVERSNHLSRKQMIEAQHRRAVIYFRRKRFAEADICAVWSMQLAKGVPVGKLASAASLADENGYYNMTGADVLAARDKTDEGAAASKDRASAVMSLMGNDSNKVAYEKEFKRTEMFRATTCRFLDALPADDAARKVTIKTVPTKPSLDDKAVEKEETKFDPELELAKKEAAAVPKQQPAVHTGPFRSQMFQNDNSMTVSLFMKFPTKEDTAKVQVDFQPNLVTVTGVPRDPSTAYIVPHAPINPAKSSYRAATMKIELTLAKQQPGKWSAFGREELTKPDVNSLPEIASDTIMADAPAPPTASTTTTAAAAARPPAARPAYPTSSKNGPKDWDHIGEDEEADDKDVDTFFKKIFKDADPDTRRAMQKSFLESNGTALSTDWSEVSKGEVRMVPPDGVEAKKW